MNRRVALVAAIALLVLGFAFGGAASQQPEGWAYELSNELMSPFCPGVTLAECSSNQAKSLILWMVVQEAAGRSRDEVRDELIARYGEGMRPAPRASGFGLSAYLIPAGFFLGGGALLAFFLGRQTRTARADPGVAQRLDPELERIVDEELAG